MPEIPATTEALIANPALQNTAIITDGRFSGATRGPCIGRVSPEAIAGGPIAFVEDDDLISIDIPKRHPILNCLFHRQHQFPLDMTGLKHLVCLANVLLRQSSQIRGFRQGDVSGFN